MQLHKRSICTILSIFPSLLLKTDTLHTFIADARKDSAKINNVYRSSEKKTGKIEKLGSAQAFICRRANLIHAMKAYRMICDGRRGLRSGGSFWNIFMTGRRSVILVIVLSYVRFWNFLMRVDFAKKRVFVNEIYDFRSKTSTGALVRNGNDKHFKKLIIIWCNK